MPVYIDGHSLKGFTKENIAELLNSPLKHGIKHVDTLLNEKEGKVFCILDSPNKEAIEKFHHDIGLSCDFITEIDQVKTEALMREEKLKGIGELSARVAHDLRNPLGVIKNALELIEITNKELDEKTKSRLELIKAASDKMTRQITEVLDFVRLRPLQWEDSSLNDIIVSSIESIKIPDNISIEAPKEDIRISCDVKQLEIVFSNLILNSIQAMYKEGGTISIRAKQDEVLSIEVEDSGPGIPQKVIEKIFDPLFTTKSSGTGLGLVSCKNIIEQHGGKISAAGKPAIFTIILPEKLIHRKNDVLIENK